MIFIIRPIYYLVADKDMILVNIDIENQDGGHQLHMISLSNRL